MLAGMTDKEMLLDRAQALIHAHPVFDTRGKRRDNPSGYIVDTLQAVFQAFFETDSFEDCLIEVVNRGGDADTTGAIAGMLAGARYGPNALPRRWLKALSPDIRNACESQARALMARQPEARPGQTV
jgi:ADP-ribosyl-[dinitrogen reductase] hydrolase